MASLLQQLAILYAKIAISWTRTKAAADSKECFQGDDNASTYSQRAQWRHVSRALSKSKPMQYQDVRIISHMLHSEHKIHAVAVELAVTLMPYAYMQGNNGLLVILYFLSQSSSTPAPDLSIRPHC
jgi:ribosomal protein S18